MTKVFGCCVDKQYGKGCTDDTCMKLPEGKTCGSCRLFPRCKAFGIATFKKLIEMMVLADYSDVQLELGGRTPRT